MMDKCVERVVSIGIFAGEETCTDREWNRCGYLRMGGPSRKHWCLLFDMPLERGGDQWSDAARAKCCLESEEETDDD